MEELKRRASIAVKYLKFINKLMNFLLNQALISLNTAPTPQITLLMIIEKAHVDYLKSVD